MSIPFVYPSGPDVRRHGPQGYADYASYLPWLRDEFSFRCVFCLLREQWGYVRGGFAIDHFLSVAHHPAHVTDYDNLLYACLTCNMAKGARLVPNPLAVLTSPRGARGGRRHDSFRQCRSRPTHRAIGFGQPRIQRIPNALDRHHFPGRPTRSRIVRPAHGLSRQPAGPAPTSAAERQLPTRRHRAVGPAAA